MTAQPVPSTHDGTSTTSTLNRLLRDHITATSNNDPRSLQRAIGPSGVGIPCDRRLAYTLLDWPTVNNDSDPLAAIIGKATHTWLADAFSNHPDFLVEQRVTVRGALAGNSDLYYKPLGAVIDWKIVGATSMRKYKSEGLSAQYRKQIHLYGMGFANAGHDVRLVGCAFIPRSGRLSDLHLILEPYDPAIAQAALDRMDTVIALVAALDIENNPASWDVIPTADAWCVHCPFFLPGSTDLSRGCPGDADREVRPAQFTGLITSNQGDNR